MSDAIQTKNQILQAAKDLFQTKGYDETSISHIQDAVGIARGTMYYHFRSKEEILDSLVEIQTQEFVTRAKKVAEDKSKPVLERIPATIIALNAKENHGDTITLEAIHKPQNALMHEKMNRSILIHVSPIFTSLIEEGIEDGIFNTPYPLEVMETFICYVNEVIDYNMDLHPQTAFKKLQALLFNLERMLQAEEGSFQKILEQFI